MCEEAGLPGQESGNLLLKAQLGLGFPPQAAFLLVYTEPLPIQCGPGFDFVFTF